MAESRELYGPPVKTSPQQRPSGVSGSISPVEIVSEGGNFILSGGTMPLEVVTSPRKTFLGVGGKVGQALDDFFNVVMRLVLLGVILSAAWGLVLFGYWSWARGKKTYEGTISPGQYRLATDSYYDFLQKKRLTRTARIPKGWRGYLMHAESASRWVNLFDVEGVRCLRSFRVPERYTSVAASPDQNFIIAQQVNNPSSKPAVVMRVSDGVQISQMRSTGERGFAFHPKHPRLLHFSERGLRAYDLNTGQLADEVRTFDAYPGSPQSNTFTDARCPRLTPSGQSLAWVSGGQARLVSYPRLKELVMLERASEFPCRGVAFSPRGEFLVGLGEDGSLPIWDTETGKLFRVNRIQEDRVAALNILLGKSTARINDVAFADGYLAVAWDGGVEGLSLARGVVRDRLALNEGATSVWVSEDGRRVVARTATGAARIWNR